MLKNATHPLAILTYDGSGQCVHPDVLAINKRFFNSKLVMVMEPYPYANAGLENPSIVVSDDGLQWEVPEGVRNPVVGNQYTSEGWYSDAVLFSKVDQLLWLYYRYNSGAGETTLFRRISGNGIEWSDEQSILRYAVSGQFASPSIFDVGEDLKMIYVDTLSDSIWMLSSRDGESWKSPQKLLNFPRAWHIAAKMFSGWLYLLINDRMYLYLLRYRFDIPWQILNGQSWQPLSHESLHPAILVPSTVGWDNGFIYRGSFLINGNTIRIWYSAASSNGCWHIGYTSGYIS